MEWYLPDFFRMMGCGTPSSWPIERPFVKRREGPFQKYNIVTFYLKTKSGVILVKPPDLSIIIPVYREKDLLHDSIGSALSQTYKGNYEILLIDNNCDDESLNILNQYKKKFPEMIRLIKEDRQGAPSARNRGILESKGQFIVMMEGDDIMARDRVEKQYNFFIKYGGNLSLLSSYYDRVNWNNDQILEHMTFEHKNWIRSLSLKDMFYSHPSTWFFKKETAIKVGCFNEGFNPRLLEDDEFNFKMYFAGELKCLPENLVRVRMPSVSYKGIKDAQVSSVDLIIKMDLFFSVLKSRLDQEHDFDFDPSGFKEIRSQWLREMGVGFMAYDNGMPVTRHLIKKALKERVFDFKNWKWFLGTFYLKKKNGEKIYLKKEEIDYLLTTQFFGQVLKVL